MACKQIETYVFRRRGRRVEFLLIRRARERTLPGVWQPVTGGIERGETAYAAAAREVREETGLSPVRWWALERLTIHYDPASDAVLAIPVFAAEASPQDPVHLSHEHDRYAFMPLGAAARRVLWASQRRSLAAVRDEILRGGANAAAREVTARIAASRSPRRAAARPRARRMTGGR